MGRMAGREVSTAGLARTSPFKHKTLIWQRENHLLYLLVILINSIDIYREGNGLSGRNQRSCESNVLRIFTFISMCNTVTFAWKAAGVRWRTKFDWLQQAMTHTVKINKSLAVTAAKFLLIVNDWLESTVQICAHNFVSSSSEATHTPYF